MIKLTERLKLMADNISKGQTMADIGTDHGFLPIYLLENGISPKVILADVSQGSLEKAMENCKIYFADKARPEEWNDIHIAKNNNISKRIDISSENGGFSFRLGDGLKVLEYGEVDSIVIAGMGGRLMCDILGADLEKSHSFKRFILQPRNGQSELRFWLEGHGFEIKKELLVREGKFICEIIVVEPAIELTKENKLKTITKEHSCEAIDISYEIPQKLFEENGELAKEFVLRKLESDQKLLLHLQSIEGDTSEREQILSKRILYMSEILKNK